MNGNEFIAAFRNKVDDQSIPADTIIDLGNDAQDELATERAWAVLTGVDTSMTWLSSDTYLTAHNAPAAMLYPLKVYVTGLLHHLREVAFEDRERFKDISNRIYWDHGQKQLYFTGLTSTNRVVTLPYIKIPTAIAADAVEIANWNRPQQKLILYRAIKLWLGGTDADDITKLQRLQFADEEARLHKRCVMLDAKLRGRARGYSSASQSVDTSSHADIVTGIE